MSTVSTRPPNHYCCHICQGDIDWYPSEHCSHASGCISECCGLPVPYEPDLHPTGHGEGTDEPCGDNQRSSYPAALPGPHTHIYLAESPNPMACASCSEVWVYESAT